MCYYVDCLETSLLQNSFQALMSYAQDAHCPWAQVCKQCLEMFPFDRKRLIESLDTFNVGSGKSIACWEESGGAHSNVYCFQVQDAFIWQSSNNPPPPINFFASHRRPSQPSLLSIPPSQWRGIPTCASGERSGFQMESAWSVIALRCNEENLFASIDIKNIYLHDLRGLGQLLSLLWLTQLVQWLPLGLLSTRRLFLRFASL